MQAAAKERHYGLDWLRIGAFAFLILYHIGMFFVPWDWHVKTARPQEWLELPMLAVNPWRLSLLFVISGVASRFLLAKMRGPGTFAGTRSVRLLIPLIAGMALFVAPQAWAELREKAGYAVGFWHFWARDYFEFGDSRGLVLPTWNHLWFVAYLWAYTMLLALLSLLPRRVKARLQAMFERAFGGWRLFVLPVLLLWAARMLLYPAFGETHALVDDPYAHLVYGFGFFFGVGLAGSQAVWSLVSRSWKPAAAAALGGYAVIVSLDLTIPGDSGDLELAVARLARSIQGWAAILALLGLAQIYLNRDTRARRYLTDAIFPYYIAHQTIIVLAGHALRPFDLGGAAEFAIILAATVAGCALTYAVARRSGWLRPLFGLRPLSRGGKREAPLVRCGERA
ncbi:MAG: acyltransferase family protein [Pseudomonadota bacterium]|nr:acyltransferase family protein [Pseudomonadota bacterium]